MLLKNINNFFRNLKLTSRDFRTHCPLLSKTKYGGRFTVTMIAGDAYGPQLMDYVKNIFRFGGVPVDFEEVRLDSTHDFDDDAQAAVKSIRRNGVAIKGNIGTREENSEYQSRNVMLRNQLDLFANVLHCKSHPGIITRHQNVDLTLIRQNTEGEYSCLEHESIPGVVESLKLVTRERSEEIARFAFEYATRKDRKKITSVHKASVMPLTDGLFLEACMAVSMDYPQIEFDTMFMDTCCMMLVRNPQRFDVLLLSNLYGNVLNNIACGLIGGAGVVSGQNFGNDCAVFEIGSRGSVNLPNPVPMLNASVDLLDYLGLKSHATIIEDSVHRTLNVDRILTPDFGGSAKVSDVIDRIIQIIQSKVPNVRC